MDINFTRECEINIRPKSILTSSQFDFSLLTVVKNKISIFWNKPKLMFAILSFTDVGCLWAEKNDYIRKEKCNLLRMDFVAYPFSEAYFRMPGFLQTAIETHRTLNIAVFKMDLS